MESHFTPWVDKRTGTGIIRNAMHRALKARFTSWVDKRIDIYDVRNALGTL